MGFNLRTALEHVLREGDAWEAGEGPALRYSLFPVFGSLGSFGSLGLLGSFGLIGSLGSFGSLVSSVSSDF